MNLPVGSGDSTSHLTTSSGERKRVMGHLGHRTTNSGFRGAARRAAESFRRKRSAGSRVIAVSGIDYAGKSTQIALLKERLDRSGQNPVVVWYRPGYSPIMNALRSGARKLRPSSLPTAEQEGRREAAFSRRWIRTLWLWLAIADSFVTFAIVVRWLGFRGHMVICDRYVNDAILDLDLRFPSEGVTTWRLLRLLRRSAPRPCVSLLLVLEWDEMLRRLEQKVEPFPDSPDVRAVRFRRYQELKSTSDATVIDACQPIELVHRDIMDRVRRVLADGS